MITSENASSKVEKISESLSRMSVRVTVDEGTSAETNKKTGTEQINNFYKGQF